MRVVSRGLAKGSLKWIQRAVEERWPALEDPIVSGVGHSIDWVSPLRNDDFAEYRDAAFLQRIGLSRLSDELRTFWPDRGPQWDALGIAGGSRIVLVEAKAHILEFCTPPTQAGPQSRPLIEESLSRVAKALGSTRGDRWPDQFYQFTNRLAHLWFLREAGIDAFMVFVGFLDDEEMAGPTCAEAWEAAYQVAGYALGLGNRHALSRFIIHAYPSVADHA